MSKRKAKNRLRVFWITFLVLGLIFLFVGFDKKISYNNPDSEYTYSDEYINSYVGGDAYNYIINGTYFTGYSVIGMGFLIMSTITCATWMVLSITDEDNKEKEEKLPEI